MKAVTLEWHLDVLRASNTELEKRVLKMGLKRRDRNSNKLVNIWDMVEGKKIQVK